MSGMRFVELRAANFRLSYPLNEELEMLFNSALMALNE